MPVLINQQTGLAEDLQQDVADSAIAGGTHALPLNDPQGKPVTSSAQEAHALLAQGFSQPSPDQLQGLLDLAKHGSTGQQIMAGIEGAAKGVAGPLATLAETKILGIDPEDIKSREEANPTTHKIAEAAGFAGSALLGTGEAALLGKAGEAATGALKLGGETAGVLGGMSAAAVRGAVEMGLFQSGDEVSKFILNDPNQSAETAAANIGLSAILGAGISAPFGAVSPLWRVAKESKVGQFIDDFKDRINFWRENPDPVSTVTDEISSRYNEIKAASVGAKRLNRQEIQKLIDNVDPSKLKQWVEDISSKVESKISGLGDDPLAGKLRSAFEDWKSAISKTEPASASPVNAVSPDYSGIPETVLRAKKPLPARVDQMAQAGEIASSENLASANRAGFNPYDYSTSAESMSDPAAIFDATDQLKSKLQEWGKFNKLFVPVGETEFRNSAKSLGRELRMSLEDTSVWGKAAERQASINKEISSLIPKVKDFERKFTEPVADNPYGREVSATRIRTYLNQLGKPDAELKQEMLRDFLDASDSFQSAVEKTHSALGLESPFVKSSLHLSRATTDDLGSGSKFADAIVKKGLSRLGGEALGAAVGAGAGSAVGHPFLGAIAGEHALGPFLSSILPSIAKPILENPASAEGLKSAIDFGMEVARGESALNRAAKAIFIRGPEPVASQAFAGNKRDKIEKKLESVQQDTASLLNVGGHTGYYLPNHASAISAVAARAVNVLGSAKPATDKMGPLDPDRVPSQAEKSQYERVMDIAENPLCVMNDIKKGTLTLQDVKALSSIYPSLYDRMKDKLTNEMIQHVSKDGNSIPYNTRMSLSLFLGSPLDSTMTPLSIQSSQASARGLPPVQQQMPSGKNSLASISKMPASYFTQSQAVELRKNRK